MAVNLNFRENILETTFKRKEELDRHASNWRNNSSKHQQIFLIRSALYWLFFVTYSVRSRQVFIGVYGKRGRRGPSGLSFRVLEPSLKQKKSRKYW